MRTAVVRVNVDPTGVLTPEQLREGISVLLGLTRETGADVVESDRGRDVQLLIASDDVEVAKRAAIDLCSKVFNTGPVAGAVTFISRGTDDDAHGVLSAFGLAGEIVRCADAEGFDVVYVTLREADLERIPESRIHTALEASLNCEVHIRTR
ncbi:hypothetical protein [Mycobacterium lacus]|uniref:Uncharacterized protein n=1 Tax=Mycobacterium lacus TaxID=169765 RepID=A0A1X1YVK7_9MYCO|nr:hypothetical protein [Mycobacterium lacus]MCV7124785.1 hypothetical protein [Mycobacterium lacus]ORW15118.1 hypothetical protein AWC15_11635 [Mycobacterium lacus]BBX95003.1 hypothetical protein MLAC_02970 [Mycobacterium lacus]